MNSLKQYYLKNISQHESFFNKYFYRFPQLVLRTLTNRTTTRLICTSQFYFQNNSSNSQEDNDYFNTSQNYKVLSFLSAVVAAYAGYRYMSK